MELYDLINSWNDFEVLFFSSSNSLLLRSLFLILKSLRILFTKQIYFKLSTLLSSSQYNSCIVSKILFAVKLKKEYVRIRIIDINRRILYKNLVANFITNQIKIKQRKNK